MRSFDIDAVKSLTTESEIGKGSHGRKSNLNWKL